MGDKDTNSFAGNDMLLARYAKALGHPARISILRHLALKRSCCFSDISGLLPLADSTVSQHLSELKDAGLIDSKFMPPKVLYSINRENWKSARKLLRGFIEIKVKKIKED